MTASTTTHGAGQEPSVLTVMGAALSSEWTKLRSVRSTMWSLLVAVGLTVGFGSLFSLAVSARYSRLDPRERLSLDRTSLSLRGLVLSVLALGVLGVLVISSEYATGMIRNTFTAVPQRRALLAAKTLVFGAVAIVFSLLAVFAAFLAGQAILNRKLVGASLGDPNVMRAIVGGAFYLTSIGLLGLAFGTILRRTAGAITTLVGLVFVLFPLVQALPSPWNDDISRFLPASAGVALISTRSGSTLISPGIGALVLAGWLAASFTVATVLVSRRDA